MTWQPDRLSPSPRIPFKPRSPGTPPSPQPKASREEVVPPFLATFVTAMLSSWDPLPPQGPLPLLPRSVSLLIGPRLPCKCALPS